MGYKGGGVKGRREVEGRRGGRELREEGGRKEEGVEGRRDVERRRG